MRRYERHVSANQVVAIISSSTSSFRTPVFNRSFNMVYIQNIPFMIETNSKTPQGTILSSLCLGRLKGYPNGPRYQCKENKRKKKYQKLEIIAFAVFVPNNAELYAFIQWCSPSTCDFPLKFVVLRFEPHCTFLHFLSKNSELLDKALCVAHDALV